nr:MAG TPA: hypothetical protein [Caudoviricetes sp.]
MAIEKGRAASASTPTALWGQSPDLILSHPVFSPGREVSPYRGNSFSAYLFR